jgi:hypothetical protein
MADTRLQDLLKDFCETVGLYPVEILRRRQVQVKGVEVRFAQYTDDEDHFYVNFDFGAIAAGRTLRVFRLMLEANAMIYAKETAVLGMDTETGCVILTLRSAFGVTGQWLADNLSYFADHAVYWQKNILDCPDERFTGVSSGLYKWMQA